MSETCDRCRARIDDDGLCSNAACESHRFGGGSVKIETPLGDSPINGSNGENTNQNEASQSAPQRSGNEQTGLLRVAVDAGVESLKRAWEAAGKKDVHRDFVTMCGFPTAGKTWTAERVIAEAERRDWTSAFDDKAKRPSKEEIAAGVVKLEGTQELMVHTLGRGPGRRSIGIVDLPGEFFSNLAGAKDEGPDDIKPVPSSLIAAIALSDRLLFTIPADVCMLGELQRLRNRQTGDAKELLERAKEMLRRDSRKLIKQRSDLYDDLKALRANRRKSAEEVDDLFDDFADASIQLYETDLLNQVVDIQELSSKLGEIFGRAAFLIQKYGRGKFLETNPNEWFTDYLPSAAIDLPRLKSRTYIALTKADRVLPLLSNKYLKHDLPEADIWADLPERHEFKARLDEHGWSDRLNAVCGDPRLVMAMIHPSLVGQLDYWLPEAQYDWVSADWQAGDWSDLLVLDNKVAGVKHVADWLESDTATGDFDASIHAAVDRLRARIEGHTHNSRGVA